MVKQLSPNVRFIVIGSLVLNGIFILWLLFSFCASRFIETTGALNNAEIQAFNQKFCVRDYQAMLDKIDAEYGDDPARAAALKNSFAINVCLRNYKTGEKLDIQPLVDQVK